MVFALVWFAVLAVAFYLFVVRPQRRQMAARQALIESVHVGDDVITSGGIVGTVRSVDDETIDLEVATGVVLKVARGAIAQRMPTERSSTDDGEAV